jgi:class 3 adenylate cyclase/ribosomal protein L40E
MICPRCQAEVPANAEFCPKCGGKLAGVCVACRTLNAPDDRFCKKCGKPLIVPADEGGPARAPGEPRAAEAERRQLTVMFCDLVGSTALSERLDPEDLRTVLRAYQAACAEVVERFEGHIALYLGDGVLAYFGYPEAHEDDPQRAVRAGLDIVSAIARLAADVRGEQGVELAVRVGIHTGLVVVGEVGGGSRHERLALGETPNLAARIQALAAPGAVLSSATTQRLVQGFFVFRDLGAHAVKGVSGPVRVYEVVSEAEARTRLDVAGTAGLTPLVGREQEAQLLRQRWDQVVDGRGHVVVLSGEAGIGKSRLVRMMTERLAGESHLRLEARCSPYYRNSPLYPLIDLLPRVLEWRREDSAEGKLQGKSSRFPTAERGPKWAGPVGPDVRWSGARGAA